MTDNELLQLVLDRLVHPPPADRVAALDSLLIGFIESRLRQREIARIRVRLDQVVRYAAGRCGAGADSRIVETSFDTRGGDEILILREEAL